MRILSLILSLIAFIGSLYSYKRTNKAIAKLDDLDNAVFQWMKEDFNSKVKREE